jgi:hypothetical protein
VLSLIARRWAQCNVSHETLLYVVQDITRLQESFNQRVTFRPSAQESRYIDSLS